MTQVKSVSSRSDYQLAHNRALTTLAQIYRAEYKVLYQAKKDSSGPRSTAQSRAKNALRDRYKEEFQKIFLVYLDQVNNRGNDQDHQLLDGDR